MSTEEIVIYTLAAIISILIIWIVRLEVKIQKIPALREGKKFSYEVSLLRKELNNFDLFRKEITGQLDTTNKKIQKNVQGVRLLRFNPFKDDGVGGNQSFSTALVDSDGNGIVISSLYSRQRVSVFAKPIESWKCEYDLSEEEKEILEKTQKDI
jgi:hypothetical protein